MQYIFVRAITKGQWVIITFLPLPLLLAKSDRDQKIQNKTAQC